MGKISRRAAEAINETVRKGRRASDAPSGRPYRESPILLAKATEDIASEAFGSVQVYVGEKGAETASEDEFDIYNRFGDLAVDDWLLIKWVDTDWERVGGGAAPSAGRCLNPCGCGGEVDRALMTVDAADFSGVADASCSYVVDGRELTYSGSGVWQTAAFDYCGDAAAFDRLTATGQGIEELTLERWANSAAVITWKNTVMWWTPYRATTLYITDEDPDCDTIPSCSICVGLDADLIADCM